MFTDIREVRAITEEWIEEYNEWRPREALQNRTPSEWKQQIQP
jgi:putative transposase